MVDQSNAQKSADPLRIGFVSLFPDWIRDSLSQSIMGRAAERGLVEFDCKNPRDYCYDLHRKVDDVPYGGHPGMLLRAEPVAVAIEHLRDWMSVGDSGEGTQSNVAVIVTEPSGKRFDQSVAKQLARYDGLIWVCGHYEGIDHRIEQEFATHVLSIGDYVLTNGELPALVMADAVVRLVPGVLGNQGSLVAESFESNLLAAPNYTRPEVWRGISIPEVLKSGHHAKISAWELEQSRQRTELYRPDLLSKDLNAGESAASRNENVP